MRVIAFNGSGRKDGNTCLLLRAVLDELQAEGVEAELDADRKVLNIIESGVV